MREVMDKYTEQEKMYRWEGRQGVENLCKLVHAIGYVDPMYMGQLAPDASIGDLIVFLEDNPGAVEAITEWIADANVPEWEEALQDELYEEDEEEEDED